tara:strand:- start:456 stop:731 length:276 start_codon:yes stop_codon:yes gene_type:complete
MPKRKKPDPIVGDVITEEVIKGIKWELRRHRIIHEFDSVSPDRQNQLEALILSVESGHEVRLTAKEYRPIYSLPGDAYLYDPKTQRLEETD